MSDRQWAGLMLGDEAYAGSRNFYHLEANVRRFYGMPHFVPTHQGRAAEHLISKILIQPGQYVPPAARHPIVAGRHPRLRERVFHATAGAGLGAAQHRQDSQGMCAPLDGLWVSAKKDLMVSIGGLLATRNRDIFEKARNLVVVYEGLHTYGGLAGRDMEAMAIGMEEMVAEENIRARVRQVEYCGKQLQRFGVPIVQPIGGHAVFLDAAAMLPHLPRV